MNYSNQYSDPISTVQLSPFNEDHWNRIVTYSPFYVHWTDLVMITEKQTNKSKLGKRSLINSIDINSMQLDDEIVLTELYDLRRAAAMPRLTMLNENNSYNQTKFPNVEHGRRTTSPVDEYQSSSDFFYQTREILKAHPSSREPSFSNLQYNTNRTLLQPQTSSTGTSRMLTNIDFGPKPQASLGVQLRQSAIARKHALANSPDHPIISPLAMCSSRRAVGSAHSGRRTAQQGPLLHSQIPQTNETNVAGGLYEQVSTDSLSSIKKSYLRSTNTSRSTIHMIKTKNDRERQKQNIGLKTVLVNPCRQPMAGDNDLEESIPNSIEVMRRLGGPITAFEKNLRYNYHRQLHQFRNGSNK